MGAKGVIFHVGDDNPCFKPCQESVANKKTVVQDVSVDQRIEVSASISVNTSAEHTRALC